MAVQRKPDETVVFSWITWPSRAVADPRLKAAIDPALLDGKRMIFGGFEVMVRA